MRGQERGEISIIWFMVGDWGLLPASFLAVRNDGAGMGINVFGEVADWVAKKYLEGCYNCVTFVFQLCYMKTKATSYRFEENDLNLAMAKSGINKPQKLMDFLLSEYVRELKPEYQSLPKDYVNNAGNIAVVNEKSETIIDNLAEMIKRPSFKSKLEERIWEEQQRILNTKNGK